MTVGWGWINSAAKRPNPLAGAATILAALGLLATAGCAKKTEADDAPKPTAEVTTAVLQSGALDRTLTAYGAVEFAPGAEKTLSSPMEARVASVLVAAGSPVKSGQVVAILTPSPQSQIDLKKAADDAIVAQQAYDRATRLKASGLDSNADLEAARATNVLAQATLQSTRTRAGGLTVRSPATGVLETLTAAPGDVVASGASLGKIGQLSAVRLRLGVDPIAAAAIHAGQAVRLHVGAHGPESAGVVESVDPQLDVQTKLSAVIVRIAGQRLSPGQPVRGDIVVGQGNGPIAPEGAIYYDQDKPYVLAVEKGVAHHHDVTLGAANGGKVEITSGVSAGTRIVIEGGASLDDGTAVKEAAPAPAAKDDG